MHIAWLAALFAWPAAASASALAEVYSDLLATPQYALVFSSRLASEVVELEDPARTVLALPLGAEPYSCLLPAASGVAAPRDTSSSSDDDSPAALEGAAARAHRLLAPLGEFCLYLTQGFWTYEYCHLSTVRQFHQPREGVRSIEFVLGRVQGDRARQQQQVQLAVKKDVTRNIVVQRYTGGSECDLTGRPREVVVQFLCNPASTEHIELVRETATCEYLVVVHTPRLCRDPAFAPRKDGVAQHVTCYPHSRPWGVLPPVQEALTRPADLLNSEDLEKEAAARRAANVAAKSQTSYDDQLLSLMSMVTGKQIKGVKQFRLSVDEAGNVVVKSIKGDEGQPAVKEQQQQQEAAAPSPPPPQQQQQQQQQPPRENPLLQDLPEHDPREPLLGDGEDTDAEQALVDMLGEEVVDAITDLVGVEEGVEVFEDGGEYPAEGAEYREIEDASLEYADGEDDGEEEQQPGLRQRRQK